MAASLRLVVDHTPLDQAPGAGGSWSRLENVHDLPLTKPNYHVSDDNPSIAYRTILLVLMAHLVVLATVILGRWQQATPADQLSAPMTVSLLAAAIPELASQALPAKIEPLIEKIKPQAMPVPKKAVINDSQMNTPSPTSEVVEQAANAQAKAETNTVPAASEAVKAAESTKEANVAEPETVIEPPKFAAAYLHNPAPKYPAISRRTGEQGRVLLKVLVSEHGEAAEVALDTSSGFERLDQAAIEAVKKWSFIPARRSNQPVSAYVLVPVKFSLNS